MFTLGVPSNAKIYKNVTLKVLIRLCLEEFDTSAAIYEQ